MQTKLRKFLSVLLALLMMAGVIAVAPVVAGAAGAEIELIPASGPVGATVQVSGIGFMPNDRVEITFDNMVVVTNVETDGTGGFTCSFTVPSRAVGTYAVKADSYPGFAVADYTVVPTIALSPASGPAGAAVTATGSNFSPEELITLTFDGEAMATNPAGVETDAAGGFTCSFAVPSKSIGDYTVVASDANRNYSETVFTVVPGYAVTVTGGTGGGDYAAGATVAIEATVPGGKLFDGWTATGVTLTETQKTSASTSFTMPGNAVTLTAGFKDAPKTIFSTRYEANLLNWLLFFLGFGFIWMWF